MLLTKELRVRYSNLFKGEDRSRILVSNVINSILIKVVSTVATLLLIPISINYINKELYGVWLTISSVIIWMGIFDLGLTNGLRNSITKSLSQKKEAEAKIYLSSTYAIMALVIVPIWLLFIFLSRYINWQAVFNTNLNPHTLWLSINIVFTSFCLTFLLKPLTALLMAVQKHFLITLLQCISNVLALVIILIWGSKDRSSFVFLSLVLSFSQPLIWFLASLVLYKRTYSALTPSLAGIDFSKWRELFGVGLKFFVIQLSVLIVYSSDNFIISQLLGNSSVTEYNIALRYFTIVTIFHAMIMAPYWTACTDALYQNDYSWLKKVTKKMNFVSLCLCGCVVIMLLISNYVFRIWVGNTIQIPVYLSFLICVYVCTGLFKETYVTFVNGTGKINLQILYSIVSGVLHIPMAYLFIKSFGLHLYGLIYVNIFWYVVAAFLWRLQFHKVVFLRSPAKLWN